MRWRRGEEGRNKVGEIDEGEDEFSVRTALRLFMSNKLQGFYLLSVGEEEVRWWVKKRAKSEK